LRTWSWERKILSRNVQKNDLDLNKLEINRKNKKKMEWGFSHFLMSFDSISSFTKNINVGLELYPAETNRKKKEKKSL